MDALERLDDWGAEHAAAAVIGPTGLLVGRGDLDRPFELASVTKPLTALAVLIACEEETIALDQPCGPPGSTVRHLLAHASGLGPELADGVLAPAGHRRIYSNAGFEALGALVAEASGIPFPQYLAEAVLGPLAMEGTRLAGSPARSAIATVSDLVQLAGEWFAPTLISPDSLARATEVAFPGLAGVLPGFGRQDQNDWGLGVELRDHKRPHWTGRLNSPSTFGHFGQSGTFVWLDPQAALALVVLTNRPFGPWAAEAWPALSDAVLAQHAHH